MTRFILKTALFSSLLLAPAATIVAQANTNTVVYGRTTLQFNSTFLQSIQGTGVVLTDLSGSPLLNNSFTFKISSGVISLQTYSGEVDHVGGIVATAPGVSIRVQNFILDLTNPQAPIVSAIFVSNNVSLGRNPIFQLAVGPNTLLSPPQNGALSVTGYNVSLTSAAASMLSQQLGGNFTAGTPLGIINIYGVLASSPNYDK